MNRDTSINEQPSQHLQHICVGEAPLNPHSQTLPRVFVNHIENAKGYLIVGAVRDCQSLLVALEGSDECVINTA